MPDTAELLERTGFAAIDRAEAPRAPKTLAGITVISDPTGTPSINRMHCFDGDRGNKVAYRDIDKAWNVDSYFRQGVDKYVELCFIRGWRYDCETDEPVAYLRRRFQLMGIMTRKPWDILIAEVLDDVTKYANCYLVKKRGSLSQPIPGIPSQGVLGNANPILGYFRADPKRLCPEFSPDGKRLIRYRYTLPTGKLSYFKANDVVHFTRSVQAGDALGNSHLGPVLDDVKTYRQCEEYVIRLLYKHLNPLLHHEVPERTPGYGAAQGDVDAAAWSHAFIAPDGMVVTPPGHKISMIGAESRALRGEGYMDLLKKRLFAGLGVSQVAMGEGETSTAGSADAQTATMHNKAHFIQSVLASQLTEYILFELLMEGGYDPTAELDKVTWSWNDFEIETRIKIENNEVQKYTNGLTTRTRALRRMGERPFADSEQEDTYVYLVTIPAEEARAEGQASIAAARGTASATGPAKQVASRNKPSNQHGARSAPKVRPK
jgi:hypothetical protein